MYNAEKRKKRLNRLEQFIFKIISIYKPQLDRWVVKICIRTGLALVTAGLTGISWWVAIALNIAKEELKKQFGTDLGITVIEWLTTIIGFALFLIGLGIYFLNKWFDKKNKEKPKLLIAILHKSIDDFLNPNFSKIRNGYYKDYEVQTIIINQTKTYKSGELNFPDYAVFEQQNLISELATLTRTNSNTEIAYFGLAHIPLLFDIGSKIADKFKIEFFEYNRNSYHWDYLEKGENNLDINQNCVSRDSQIKEAVIKIEISYPINDILIQDVVSNIAVFKSISLNPIKLDSINNTSEIKVISQMFRESVDKIISEHPDITLIHLFYSGPVSLAINLGRKISKRTDPKFLVYNYMSNAKPKYKWAINLNEDDSSKIVIN